MGALRTGCGGWDEGAPHVAVGGLRFAKPPCGPDSFQADGPGWQERINAALRKVVGKQGARS